MHQNATRPPANRSATNDVFFPESTTTSSTWQPRLGCHWIIACCRGWTRLAGRRLSFNWGKLLTPTNREGKLNLKGRNELSMKSNLLPLHQVKILSLTSQFTWSVLLLIMEESKCKISNKESSLVTHILTGFLSGIDYLQYNKSREILIRNWMESLFNKKS